MYTLNKLLLTNDLLRPTTFTRLKKETIEYKMPFIPMKPFIKQTVPLIIKQEDPTTCYETTTDYSSEYITPWDDDSSSESDFLVEESYNTSLQLERYYTFKNFLAFKFLINGK
jgi:hypothetical protein